MRKTVLAGMLAMWMPAALVASDGEKEALVNDSKAAIQQFAAALTRTLHQSLASYGVLN